MARTNRLSGKPSEPSFVASTRRRPRRGVRLQLEPLEQRLLLAPVSWVTDGDGFWDVATNWLDDMAVQRVPGVNDDVVIDRGAADPVVTIRSGAQSVNSLQARERLSITGGSLTIAADSEMSNEFTLSVGTLTVNGQLTLTGASTWTSGTVIGNVRNEGALTISPPSFFNYNNGTLTNAGTITQTSSVLQFNGCTVENLPGALYDIQHAGTVWSGSGPGFGVINNSGTVQKSANAGVTTTSLTTFNNLAGGVVSVLTGELDLSNGGSLQGSLQAEAGAMLDFSSGTFALTGTLTGSGAGKVRLGGATFNGTGASAMLDFPTGLFEWRTGVLTGTLANAGELTINPPSFVNLNNGTLTNAGTIIQAASVLQFNGGIIANLPGALYDIQHAGTAWSGVGPGFGTINNSGTLQKSVNASVATTSLTTFNNLPGGNVAALVGELRFNSNTNWQGGEFQVAAGASVTLNGGTHTLSGLLTGSGAGKVKLTGNTVQVATGGAQLDFDLGVLDWNGGVLSGSTLTNTGALTINAPSVQDITNGTLANAGMITHTSGQIRMTGGTIKNLPGGTFEVQHSSSFLSGQSPGFGVFDNRGMFLKTTSATAATTPLVSFDNRAEGRIEVRAGTLSLSGGGRNEGGALHAEPGAVLNFVAGGTHVLAGHFTGTGGGKIRMTSGRALIGSAGATFDFDPGVFEWTGGVLTGFAPLVNKGSMLVNGVVTIDDGVLTNAGVITQIGTPFTSNIQLTRGGITGGVPTGINVAFNILEGALYDMQMAPGTFGITGFQQGQEEVNNFGTIRKSSPGLAGFGSVRLNNEGVIESLDGDVQLFDPTHLGSGSIVQMNDGAPSTGGPGPLTGGTWRAVGNGRIIFPANITSNGGTIILEGNGDIPQLSAMASNSGTISLLGGKDFTRAGDFTNTGRLTFGPDSTLTVNSTLTLGAASEIDFQIGGTPASGLFGKVMAIGAATLDGAADLELVNGFDPQAGQAFQLMAFTSRTGDFDSFDDGAAGRTVVFSSATAATDFTVNVLADGADLDVDTITVPASGLAGQIVTIDYTVNNASAFATPAGPWTDSLYLSLDDTYDPSDKLLGRVTHIGAVGGNTSYPGQLVAPLPGVMPGNYRVLVNADSRGLVPDTDRGNNTLASTGVIAVDIPALMPGVTSGGTIASGQDLFFRVALPEGRTPSFTLDTGAAGGAELYLRQLDVPDRANFDDVAFDPATTTQRILNFGAAATTHFILVHGRENAGAGTAFTITAEALDFGIVTIEHNSGAPFGRVTTTVHGSLFTPDTTFSLVPSFGAVLPAVQTVFQDASSAFVTFDLTGLPLGNYGVRATQGAAQVTFNAGFTVVTGTPGALDFHITTPRFIRPPFRGAVLTIEYENVGGADLIAPIIVLIGDTAKMRLPESVTFSTGSIQLLAVNPDGPAGILPPGARGTIDVIFEPLTIQSLGETNFEAFVPNSALSEPIDWEELREDFQPAAIPDDAWNAIYDNFVAQMGASFLQYNAVLAENATHLASIGQGTADVGRLLAFELEQAGDFGAIEQRFQLGPIGRGRTAPFDVKAFTDADGNVTVQLGTEVRAFAALPFGEFRTIANDGSVLQRLGNGALELAEPTGARTVFRASDGKLDFLEDTRGNRATAAYDAAGRLDTITLTNGDVIDFSYNAAGFISQVTDAVGRNVTLTYDAAGHLLTRTDPLGTTSFTYSGTPGPTLHALTQITLPDGSHINSTYDPQGRLAMQERDGGTGRLTFAYDSAGGVTITDLAGSDTTLFRGVGGAPLKIVDALGRVTIAEVGRDGLLNRLVGPDGATLDFEHGPNGRPSQMTDALGRITAFDFDDNGRLLGLTNALGNTTQFGFDAESNLTSVTDAGGGMVTFSYEARGNAIATVTERGQIITFTYDAKDLLTRKDLPDGTHVDFTYDAHRNLLSASERDAANADLDTTSFEYDAADRLTKVTYPNGKFLTFTSDTVSRRATATDQDGFTIRYAYDSLGRLDTLRDTASALIVDYDYDTLGRLTLETRGNGAVTSYTYDALNRTDIITHRASAGGAVIESFDYAYDTAGRVSAVTDSHGTTVYGYDFTGQLENVALPGGRTLTYAYDANGNRTLATDNGAPTAYAVNLLDQYTSVGAATLAYDGDGHLITRTDAFGTTSYSYDAEGRLTGLVSSGGTFSYDYDALGTRIGVVENGTRTDLLVDPAGFGNVFAEYEGGALTANYAHGLGVAARIENGGAASFYHYDITGNTTALSGAAGAVLNTYQYLPFGEIAATTGAAENAFTFNGRFGIEDRGDGLYFMRNRSYDAVLGRFISDDPIGLLGGDANTYRYSLNDPVNSTDPSGLDPVVVSVQGVLYIVEAGAQTFLAAAGEGIVADIVVTEVVAGTTALTPAAQVALAEEAARNTALTSITLTSTTAVEIGAGLGTVSVGVAAAGVAVAAAGGYFIGTVIDQHTETFNPEEKQKFRQFLGEGFNLGPEGGPPIAGDQTGQHDSDYNDRIRKLYDDPCVRYQTKINISLGRSPQDALLEARRECRKFEQAEASAGSSTVISTDPNNIIGPAGFNADVVVDAPAPGQMRFDGFVGDDAPFNYSILFENKPTASAPAQVVRVTQQLDADLDLATFRFQNVGWGNFLVDVPDNQIGTSFHTTVDATAALGVLVQVDADVNVATGLLEVVFTSLDPQTGDLPLDPFAGFLPPNVVAPQGDGFINYSVRSKPGLADGTRIDALATIVFDTEAPLDTPMVHNTIDGVAPTSSVNPLPATTFSSTKSFTVSWTGSDDAGGTAGSGVALFDVFVSDNGGPFNLFLGSTPDTSATFAGEFGHTFRFFSVATDGVGNVQPSPGAAQATTMLADPGPRITDARINANATRKNIANFVLTFDEALAPSTANNPASFILHLAGRDKRIGTADDSPLPIASAVYDAALRTVTLTPQGTKPLKLNQFIRVTAKGAGGVTNLNNTALDGDADNSPGGDFVRTLGLGTKLSFADATGDTVSLNLKKGGLVELSLPAAADPTVRLTATVAGSSTLTATVKKPKTGASDGRATIASILGAAGVSTTGVVRCTPALTTNCLVIGSISAMVVDAVLDVGLPSDL